MLRLELARDLQDRGAKSRVGDEGQSRCGYVRVVDGSCRALEEIQSGEPHHDKHT